jgi:hypothetical protein
MLLRVIRSVLAPTRAPAPTAARLVPAVELVARFRAARGPAFALALTRAQVDAALALVNDERGWQRLQELVARAGDPWNADDWPDGFDPLLLCAALCDDVAFECVRCPVGQRQDGRSCAHPQSLFGSLLPLLMRGERAAVADRLRAIDDVLDVLASPRR